MLKMIPETNMRMPEGRIPQAVTITPERAAYALLTVVGFLLLANLGIIYLRFMMGFEHLRGFIQGFYFDAEANFPSLYSALAIAISAYFLWLIGALESERVMKRSFYWKLLAVFFLFLALDEFGSLHEYMIQPMRRVMETTSVDADFFYFAWFIPYAAVLLVLGIILLKFLVGLPPQTRWTFLLGGLVFLAGAVGMEMLGGKYWAAQGWSIDGKDAVDMNYALIVTVEEFLEMIGIVIFIYGLMRYYLKSDRRYSFLITFSGSPSKGVKTPD